MANEYSPTWFDTFLAAIPDEAADLEVRGLARTICERAAVVPA